MKLFSFILLTLLGISCGGVTVEKNQTQTKVNRPVSPAVQNNGKLAHLKTLEHKYLQENKPIKLAITRGMIMEMENKASSERLKYPADDLKKLRKNQAFLSLEMTIEHLSHREQFKLGTRHSAFHKRP